MGSWIIACDTRGHAFLEFTILAKSHYAISSEELVLPVKHCGSATISWRFRPVRRERERSCMCHLKLEKLIHIPLGCEQLFMESGMVTNTGPVNAISALHSLCFPKGNNCTGTSFPSVLFCKTQKVLSWSEGCCFYFSSWCVMIIS